jgi:hypothetical protein
MVPPPREYCMLAREGSEYFFFAVQVTFHFVPFARASLTRRVRPCSRGRFPFPSPSRRLSRRLAFLFQTLCSSRCTHPALPACERDFEAFFRVSEIARVSVRALGEVLSGARFRASLSPSGVSRGPHQLQ